MKISMSISNFRRILLVLFCLFGGVYQSFSQEQAGSQERAGENEPHIAYHARLVGDENRVRLLIDFDREPDAKFYYLKNPHRLIIDLPKTNFLFDADELKARGLLNDIRYGTISDHSSRIVLALNATSALESQDVQLIDGQRYRLVLDISVVSGQVFEEIIQEQDWNGQQRSGKTDRIKLSGKDKEDSFVVVLDAGHGGVDGGAEGRNGAIEKDITLSFVKDLAEDLNNVENLKVVLTRTEDKFVSLGARVRIGRQAHADLFISIHADTIKQTSLRGASIYTLSEKASDAVTEGLAESENRTDVLAGLDIEDTSDEVTDILVDLARRETEILSDRVAERVVSDFEGQVLLIKNPHRRAGFRVLQAPDVPSVLIELGFLSNPQDEKLLMSENWRHKTTQLLAQSILSYQERALDAR